MAARGVTGLKGIRGLIVLPLLTVLVAGACWLADWAGCDWIIADPGQQAQQLTAQLNAGALSAVQAELEPGSQHIDLADLRGRVLRFNGPATYYDTRLVAWSSYYAIVRSRVVTGEGLDYTLIWHLARQGDHWVVTRLDASEAARVSAG